MKIVSSKPGQGMVLHSLSLIEPSIVPATEQERTRLLLEMKLSRDFYDLHFAIAEYSGFVRGLFMSNEISPPQLVMFQLHARRVAQQAADRLAKVTA